MAGQPTFTWAGHHAVYTDTDIVVRAWFVSFRTKTTVVLRWNVDGTRGTLAGLLPYGTATAKTFCDVFLGIIINSGGIYPLPQG